MLNKATIMGRLGANPDIRNEGKIANLTIATTESWKNKDGNKQERTEWHRVVIFNEKLISNVVEKFIKKGTLIYIEGKIKTRKYTDKEGIEKYTTEIVIENYSGLLKLIPTTIQKDENEHIDESLDIEEEEIPF